MLKGTKLNATTDLEICNQLKFACVFKVIVHFYCYNLVHIVNLKPMMHQFSECINYRAGNLF